MKHQKAAAWAKKASGIVLSGCIAASAAGSVSVVEVRKTSLEAKASQRLQAAAAPSYAATVQSPAALQNTAGNTQTQAAAAEYQICDENGQNWRMESREAVPVTSDMTALSDGWYVVNGQVDISNSITVSGNVCLILADGCTLTVGGIQVSGEGGANSLQIFAQSDGDAMGRLVSTAAGDAAGIGGGAGEINGSITIFGGNVEAAGGARGAGIGGGKDAAGQNITIHGGRVTAKAYTAVFDGTAEDARGGGAGIGGGQGGDGRHILITGGTVHAEGTLILTFDANGQPTTSSGGGAGIGGGSGSGGTAIAIRGGTVTAVGSEAGAGIGGGGGSGDADSRCYGSDITIEGGVVTAKGGGAGIGGGQGGTGTDIKIFGGTVTAQSITTGDNGGGGAGIGGGMNGIGQNIMIEGGTITTTGGTFGGGAGIGGGCGQIGIDITISGGTIIATGGSAASKDGGAAGIGSGSMRSLGSISTGTDGIRITGGRIEATGGRDAAAIGGGASANATGIEIEGAVVFAKMDPSSGNDVSPIGSGKGGDSTGTPQLENCIVFERNSGKVYGYFTFREELGSVEMPSDAELVIPDGTSLTIADQSKWINKGRILNNGTLLLENKENGLFIEENGRLEGSGKFYFAFSNGNFPESGALYRVYNGENHSAEVADYLREQTGIEQKLGGQSFTIYIGDGINLPDEMRNAQVYDITAGESTVRFEIQPAKLHAVSAVPVQESRIYDGSDQILIKSVEIAGVINGDEVSVDTGQVVGILASSKAGTYYTVILRGMKLTGRDKNNYDLPENSDDVSMENPQIQLETAFQILPRENTPAQTTPGSSAPWPDLPFQTIVHPAARLPYLESRQSVRGWTQLRAQAAQAVSGASLEINMNGNSKVPKEMLRQMKNKYIRLILRVEDGIAWEICGQDMTSDTNTLEDIDVTVSFKAVSDLFDALALPSGALALPSEAEGKPAYRLTMKHNGAFGCPVTLVLPLGPEHAGVYANVYCRADKDGALAYDSCAVADTDGSVRLSFTQGAAYVIVLDSKSHKIPEEVWYEAQLQEDGSIRIAASDGSAVANMFVTAADGVVYYADAHGLAARNQIVTADGQRYFAKQNGAIARNEFCHTKKGSLIYAQEDGTLASNRVVTSDGKKYYAKGNCALARDGFFVTKKGSLVYARASGELYTGRIFRAAGRLYYAKPSGALARDGFYNTVSRDKIYAGSSGALKTNKLFRVKGKLFYADKKGRVLKNSWVSVGKKQYYCSRAYKITKTKTKK